MKYRDQLPPEIILVSAQLRHAILLADKDGAVDVAGCLRRAYAEVRAAYSLAEGRKSAEVTP